MLPAFSIDPLSVYNRPMPEITGQIAAHDTGRQYGSQRGQQQIVPIMYQPEQCDVRYRHQTAHLVDPVPGTAGLGENQDASGGNHQRMPEGESRKGNG